MVEGVSKDVVDIEPWDAVKSVRVGNVAVDLCRDGTIALRGDGLIDKKLRGLSKSDLQDLLVALDAVQGEQPEPDPSKADMRETIIGGAHALARDVYRLTAYKATVTVTVHPQVFHSLIVDMGGQISGEDYRHGRIRVAGDVEIKLDRGC